MKQKAKVIYVPAELVDAVESLIIQHRIEKLRIGMGWHKTRTELLPQKPIAINPEQHSATTNIRPIEVTLIDTSDFLSHP